MNQTYQNWKIMFVDDCSSDDTVKRVLELRNLDPQIILFQNHVNSGAAISRNKVLKEAKAGGFHFWT